MCRVGAVLLGIIVFPVIIFNVIIAPIFYIYLHRRWVKTSYKLICLSSAEDT
ncbi:MAG: DUF2517 family protein [Arsenophonus sp. NC-PG7-MAG3]